MRGILWLCLALLPACQGKPAGGEKTADEVLVAPPSPSPTKPPWIGVIVPTDAQDVLAPYASTVTSLPISVGQRVAAGDVVASLDPRPIQEELATARAALAQAQAALRSARVSAEAASAAVARAKAAFEGSYGAKEDIAIAESNEKLAAAAVSQNEASVAQQQVTTQMLQGRSARTRVRANISGEVARKYVEVGGKVERDVPLLRIIGKGSLLLRFAVPLAESGSVLPGLRLKLACAVADTEVAASAEVTHMSPEADSVAQMMLGEAALMDVPGVVFAPGTVCRLTQ
ncbi:MAG: HlyD family efflux transporter periplasmic adaptor subunit [Myxococcales bacterium]|nr:HlyD family efflux transporter periplasmic adaptor subunit [Myxococcales bacterium]